MGKKKTPNASQREFLLLGCVLHGEKYGLEIRDEFEKRTGEPMPLGSLYVTLDRMEDKGFLKTREGEPNPERGGNNRKYYKITATGTDAFNRFQQAIASMMPKGGLARGN